VAEVVEMEGKELPLLVDQAEVEMDLLSRLMLLQILVLRIQEAVAAEGTNQIFLRLLDQAVLVSSSSSAINKVNDELSWSNNY
jgi:transcriptional regulator CtsR